MMDHWLQCVYINICFTYLISQFYDTVLVGFVISFICLIAVNT